MKKEVELGFGVQEYLQMKHKPRKRKAKLVDPILPFPIKEEQEPEKAKNQQNEQIFLEEEPEKDPLYIYRVKIGKIEGMWESRVFG